MRELEQNIRNAAKDLLAEGKVEVIIGYEKGSLPLTSRPCFVRKPEDVDKLIWNSTCTNNLAVYLPRLFTAPPRPPVDYKPPKVGVIAKGCDARSIVGHVKENKFASEDVVVIGVPCRGMIDMRKTIDALNGKDVVGCAEFENGSCGFTTADGETISLDSQAIMHEACEECISPVAENPDIRIEGSARDQATQRFQKIAGFESMAPDARWREFEAEISKCVRCYACRQACPNCYCPVCFADTVKPDWIDAGDDPSDLMAFHMGRILHQAGRCVECDACVRACPMGIDLRFFTQKVVKDAEDMFDFSAGVSADPPPLTTFNDHDDERCRTGIH